MENTMILGKNNYYSLDSHRTGLNNNVCIVGASGAGKTRSVVIPNLLMATGSYIVTDPKGNLYEQYGDYLRKKGYKVKKLDFTDPKNSAHYNFFHYIHEPMDIFKVAHMIVYEEQGRKNLDPFWDQSAEMLLTALIALLIEHDKKDVEVPWRILMLLELAKMDSDSLSSQTTLGRQFNRHREQYPDSWACKQYDAISVAPERTWNSIVVTLAAKLRNFEVEEIKELMAYDDIDIISSEIGAYCRRIPNNNYEYEEETDSSDITWLFS